MSAVVVSTRHLYFVISFFVSLLYFHPFFVLCFFTFPIAWTPSTPFLRSFTVSLPFPPSFPPFLPLYFFFASFFPFLSHSSFILLFFLVLFSPFVFWAISLPRVRRLGIPQNEAPMVIYTLASRRHQPASC